MARRAECLIARLATCQQVRTQGRPLAGQRFTLQLPARHTAGGRLATAEAIAKQRAGALFEYLGLA